MEAGSLLFTPKVERKTSGFKRKRTQSMEIVSQPSQAIRTITRYPVSRRRKNPYKAPHKFKRTFNVGSATISCDGINPTMFQFNFSMNDMPGYTELTNLFDSYKLRGVLVRALPYQQGIGTGTSAANNVRNVPIFYTIDRNDQTTPTGVDEICEYNEHKISNVWNGFRCYVSSPKFQDATNAERTGWVSTANATLNWLGLKGAIPATGVACNLYMTWTYYVDCKDPK